MVGRGLTHTFILRRQIRREGRVIHTLALFSCSFPKKQLEAPAEPPRWQELRREGPEPSTL